MTTPILQDNHHGERLARLEAGQDHIWRSQASQDSRIGEIDREAAEARKEAREACEKIESQISRIILWIAGNAVLFTGGLIMMLFKRP